MSVPRLAAHAAALAVACAPLIGLEEAEELSRDAAPEAAAVGGSSGAAGAGGGWTLGGSAGAAGVPDPDASADADGSPSTEDCSAYPGATALVLQGRAHCYWLEASSMLQASAAAACQSQGGYLVTIHSQQENEVVATMAGSRLPIWIGMSRPTDGAGCLKADYRWVTGEPSLFDGWEDTEPDCSGSGVVMIPGGRWRDRTALSSYSYVCESGPLISTP
jgi:hypothetical protein